MSKERDDFLDECNEDRLIADPSKAMFENMMDEKSSDWFGQNEPDYEDAKADEFGETQSAESHPQNSSTPVKPAVQEEPKSEDTKSDENMEKMDTSPPESTPWPEEVKPGKFHFFCIDAVF